MSKRKLIPRSPRLESRPDFSNFVHYSEPGKKAEQGAAQFIDLSGTGMNIICRHASKAQPGDIIEVEFTMPGQTGMMKSSARVVRRISEFGLAIKFVGLDEAQQKTLHQSIERYMKQTLRPFMYATKRKLVRWYTNHSQGLALSLAALAVFGGLTYSLYSSSDEHLHHKLKPWGASYPAQWDRDYINGFSSDKK